MIEINLRRNRLRYGRRLASMRDPSGWLPYVRLFRIFPVAGTPAPMLHRPGVQVTPTRMTPWCADGSGGPYGRVEWHRPALIQDPLCRTCFPEGRDARAGGTALSEEEPCTSSTEPARDDRAG